MLDLLVLRGHRLESYLRQRLRVMPACLICSYSAATAWNLICANASESTGGACRPGTPGPGGPGTPERPGGAPGRPAGAPGIPGDAPGRPGGAPGMPGSGMKPPGKGGRLGKP